MNLPARIFRVFVPSNKWRAGLFCLSLLAAIYVACGPAVVEDPSGEADRAPFKTTCDLTVSPKDDVNKTIAALGDASTSRTICFAPGTYTKRIVIEDKNKLVLYAPDGGVDLKTATKHTESPSATLNIYRCEDIQLVGLTVTNRHQFTEKHQISRAIFINESQNIGITSCVVRSRGKQTLRINDSSVNVIDSDLECYYFCVDPGYSEVHVKSSRLTCKHETHPHDVHSLIWTHRSNQTYEDTTFEMKTGRALVSGVNDFTTNRIIVHGHTQGRLHSWVQQHPSYNGIFLQIYGQWPSKIKDYFYNPYLGGGSSKQVQIEKFPNQIYEEPEPKDDEWASTTLPVLYLLF